MKIDAETVTLTPEDTAAHGNLVLTSAEAILAARWVCADGARKAADALRDALEVYSDIRDDRTHESAYYDVAGEAEPKHEALKLAAQEIADLAGDLILALPACQVTAEGAVAA